MAADLRVIIGTSVLGLLAALLFLYFALFARASAKPAGPPVVLIAGPSGSGKTALFQIWTSPDDVRATVTSVRPNRSARFVALDGAGLVDVPGNEKLQQYTADEVAHSNVKAVVFVVDAASGVVGIEAAAERLFVLLERAELRRIPVLVAANKFDLFNTLSLKKITAVLEDALTGIRDTRSRTVPTSEDDAEWHEQERPFLGLDGKPFQFGDLETDVTVLEGSVKSRRTAKWEDWLQDVAS